MKIVLLGGIAERRPSPMLSAVTRRVLDKHVVALPYRAQYGPFPNPLGTSFKSTNEHGREILEEELEKGPAVVLSYSGGCVPAGEVAANGHRNMVALGMIADPKRPPAYAGDWFGVAGERPMTKASPPVMWKTDPKDGIARCPRFSPLRTLSDQSEAFSLVDPLAWTWSLYLRMLTHQWQPAKSDSPAATAEQYKLAARLLFGYLRGGDHTSYAIRREPNGRTYTDNLATWVEQFRALA